MVGVALAAITALWEAVLTPWYVVVSGHVLRLPVAPLLAIVANIAIVWFTMRVTDRIGLSLVPAVGWLVVMFAAGTLTSDGDLIVEGTWVGLTTILLGAFAWAIGAYVASDRRRRRVTAVPPVAAEPAAQRASTRSGRPGGKAKPGPGPAPRPGTRPDGRKRAQR